MKLIILVILALAMIFSQNHELYADGFNDIGARDESFVWAAGDSGNVSYSNNGGVNWIKYKLDNISYYAVSVKAQYIFIGGENGILKISSDGGVSFNQYSIGSSNSIRSIHFYNVSTGWIAGDNGMILKTTNSGLNWISQTSNTSSNLNSIKFYNSLSGVACGNAGIVCITTNGGNNWVTADTHVSTDLLSTGIYGTTIICSGKDATVIKSTDGSGSWNSIDYKLEMKSDVNSVSVLNDSVFYSVGGGGFIWRSTNAGLSFDYQQNPFLADLKRSYFINSNTGWCISKSTDAIIRTGNGGNNWLLPPGFSQSFSWILKIPLNILSPATGNVFATNAKNKNEIFMTKSNLIYRSLDKGDTWTLISTIPGYPVNSHSPSNAFLISPKDTNVFLVAIDSGTSYFGKVFRSTDYGQTWSYTFYGNRSSDGCPLEMDPNHSDTVYYAPIDSFLFRSTNFGITWNQVGTKKFDDICKVKVIENNSNILIVGNAFSGGVKLYRTTDSGLSWAAVSDTNANEIPDIANIKLNPSFVYCTYFQGSGGSLKRSTNQGANWTNVNTDARAWAIDIAKDDPNVYAYGVWQNYPVFITTNGGTTFLQTNNLLGGAYALFYYDRSTLLAQMTEGLFKLKITYHNPVGIHQISSVVPSEYMLSQNYPNPFNPNTVIRYSLIENRFVNLKVYDALGKVVTTLVNQKLNAGSYEVEFDGANLPSGIYFYKLQAGDYSEVKRMILLK